VKKPELLQEFCRYIVVGGTAFLVDIGLLYVLYNFVFFGLSEIGIYISTALGFLGGLVYNYWLSLVYVFRSAKEKNKGKTFSAFVVFSLIGVGGLFLTELGMFLGVEILTLHYLIVKVFVAALVLFWNYGVRKVLIFR